jgi:curved DNA-binding protein CbpA
MGHTRRSHDDPYEVLGVQADASRRDIVRAYHRAAQRAHPDVQPHDQAAMARFQALTDAYELLTDPGRRAEYDRGHRAPRPTGPRWADPARWPRGNARLPGPPWHQPVWAGPVLVEPPATAPPAAEPPATGRAAGQHWRGAPAAEWSDPPVALGVRAHDAWGRVW